jgi:hypothetical protein
MEGAPAYRSIAMVKRHSLMDLFEKKSTVLIALASSVIFFLCLEMLIFIASASISGERSTVEVKDKQGSVVYRTPGNSIDNIDRWRFAKKFGSLDSYDVEIKTVNKPFPVRAWVSASVGVPIVLILLISYLVKVYMTLLHGNETESSEKYPVLYGKVHPFISWTMFLSSHSIFYLGFLIGLAALVFWMVPNFISDVVSTSVSIMYESKWLILGPVAFIAVFAIWVAYLRYRLSKRMMDYQYSLEKYRLERELQQNSLPAEVRESASRSVESS